MDPIQAFRDQFGTIIGTVIDSYVLDEFELSIRVAADTLYAIDDRFVLDDPKYPEAQIVVERHELNKRDPRHPNPRQGTMREYRIFQAGRRLGTAGSFKSAKKQAERLHVLAIKAAKLREEKKLKDALSANDTYGAF